MIRMPYGQARILAVDPGLKCGWTVWFAEQGITSGWWELRLEKTEDIGAIVLRFWQTLQMQFLLEELPSLVVYERVQKLWGEASVRIYASLVATLLLWCKQHNIPYEGVAVVTWRRLLCGPKKRGQKITPEEITDTLMCRGFWKDEVNPPQRDQLSALGIAWYAKETYLVR